MLRSHMKAIQETLVATSKIPAIAGHALHKGTPREAFIKEFLEGHLSSNVSIGTGEVIDANSKPAQPRNQYDIVIYKNTFPKLDFGGGINSFLVESVVATIEVKSTLDFEGIDQATKAAHNLKELTPSLARVFRAGWIPPKPLNYVVAYDGPAKMSTVKGWIEKSHRDNSIPVPTFDKNVHLTPGTGIDGVFLLKKGFVVLNNIPFGFKETEEEEGAFTFIDDQDDSILVLFLLLQMACNNLQGEWLDAIPYLK